MVKTSRITQAKKTVIKRMKRGKTTGHQQRRILAKENRFFWLMGIFFAVYISWILYLDFEGIIIRENWPASRTVFARVDFRCKDVEQTKTEQERRVKNVPNVYQREKNWIDQNLKPINKFIQTVQNDNSAFDEAKILWEDNYLEDFPLQFAELVKNDAKIVEVLKKELGQALGRLQEKGLISREDIDGNELGYIVIYPSKINEKVSLRRFLQLADGLRNLETELKKKFSITIAVPTSAILNKNLTPSLKKSVALTLSYKEDVKKGVTTLYKEVFKGTIIINEGDPIKHAAAVEIAAEQRAFKKSLTNIDKLKMVLGNLVFTSIFIIMIALYMYFFEREISLSEGKLFGYFLLIMAFLVTGKILHFFGLPANAVPLIFIGMVSGIVINLRFAIFMIFILALMTGNIFKIDIDNTVALFASGVVGVSFCSHIRRRIRILEGGFLGGLVNTAIIYAVAFARNINFGSVWLVGLSGLFSGVGSGIILIGILPLIEYMFDTTTEIRLLELSDQGHPLLRNLFLQAAGTYTHSLSVGNLAESAAGAIGANALLARVASYYHDIGKIFKPEYFIENQNVGGNKHDRLKPGLSSLVIAYHTRDGVDLGREYNLPQRILDVVIEHHGTGKIVYFLQKAQSLAGDKETVDEEFFRYPGPKPSSKESGIVLLADSIEAASRTLSDPSPSSLRKIVERIIKHKMDDHQLDETGLTLVELSKIRESFIVVLFGIFHARIEYPEEKK